MEIFFIWLAGSIVAAVIADKKGRSPVGFFFLAALLSPLIGIIAALVASPDTKVVERKLMASRQGKRCPFCAEIIKPEALICRFCGKEQPEKEAAVAAEDAAPNGSWTPEDPDAAWIKEKKTKDSGITTWEWVLISFFMMLLVLSLSLTIWSR